MSKGISLARTTAVLAATSALLIGLSSGQASAAEWGQRKSGSSGKCLAGELAGGTWYVNTRSCGQANATTKWSITGTQGGTRTFQKDTGYCLDAVSSGRLYVKKCNGGNNQKWREQYVAAGWRYQNVATGKYLDSNKNGEAYTSPSNSLPNQVWKVA